VFLQKKVFNFTQGSVEGGPYRSLSNALPNPQLLRGEEVGVLLLGIIFYSHLVLVLFSRIVFYYTILFSHCCSVCCSTTECSKNSCEVMSELEEYKSEL